MFHGLCCALLSVGAPLGLRLVSRHVCGIAAKRQVRVCEAMVSSFLFSAADLALSNAVLGVATGFFPVRVSERPDADAACVRDCGHHAAES
jgi:hypothetical protein